MRQGPSVSISSTILSTYFFFTTYMYLLLNCTLPSTTDSAHNRSAAIGHSSRL